MSPLPDVARDLGELCCFFDSLPSIDQSSAVIYPFETFTTGDEYHEHPDLFKAQLLIALSLSPVEPNLGTVQEPRV